MDNSKARAIAANNFPEVDFSANTKTQLALIKFKLIENHMLPGHLQ